MDEKKAQFLPFHAINEFMRDDFRTNVVKSTLNKLTDLPPDKRAAIEQITRKAIQIPGFRNSLKSPVNLRLKPTEEEFEKNPLLVAAILSAWADIHMELRQKTYDLLVSRNWEVLPPDIDRTALPGFLTVWPVGEDFPVLIEAYRASFPSDDVSDDDISLMVVWISGRLPYSVEGEE